MAPRTVFSAATDPQPGGQGQRLSQHRCSRPGHTRGLPPPLPARACRRPACMETQQSNQHGGSSSVMQTMHADHAAWHTVATVTALGHSTQSQHTVTMATALVEASKKKKKKSKVGPIDVPHACMPESGSGPRPPGHRWPGLHRRPQPRHRLADREPAAVNRAPHRIASTDQQPRSAGTNQRTSGHHTARVRRQPADITRISGHHAYQRTSRGAREATSSLGAASE